MKNTQIIAERIKIQSKIQGITVKKLLENCELGVNTVTKMANGTDIFSQNLTKIADYLDVSVDYLLGRTDEPKTVCGHSIKTGDIGDNISHSDTSVKISESQSKQLDETAQQLVNAFQQLNFMEKAKVMGIIAELINK